jgi:hypothetical protein
MGSKESQNCSAFPRVLGAEGGKEEELEDLDGRTAVVPMTIGKFQRTMRVVEHTTRHSTSVETLQKFPAFILGSGANLISSFLS